MELNGGVGLSSAKNVDIYSGIIKLDGKYAVWRKHRHDIQRICRN